MAGVSERRSLIIFPDRHTDTHTDPTTVINPHSRVRRGLTSILG